MSIRVLVVDDSATMRGLITLALQQDSEIVVVGHARDAIEAREAIKMANPDVITLDIEMPNMNGLEFLEKIMRLRPTPVIMVSTLTQQGAEANLRALEIGAFDCISKSYTNDTSSFDQLTEKVKLAAQSRWRTRLPHFVTDDRSVEFALNNRVVAIGASTGGVEALLFILSKFPKNCPPTLITQHMPALFTKKFAERLNRHCAPEVSEALDNAQVKAGNIYIAPGNTHLELSNQNGLRCKLSSGDKLNGHRPSVDALFSSVARVTGNNATGVILTGMGRDGANGLLELRRVGAETFGQDEASSVVYGMPKIAFEIGAVKYQVPLEKMAEQILLSSRAEHKVTT